MAKSYPRGSEWRKWDLHVHTPLTHLANDYGKWEDFIEKVVKSELAVIGVTNYFCFEPDEVEKVREAIAKSGGDVSALPNVEFRIQHPNKQGDYINLHVIFAEGITTAAINESLSKIKLVNTGTGGRPVYCEDKRIKENGFDYTNVLIDYRELLKQLNSDFAAERDFLVAALPRGHGDFRPAKGDGRANALAVEIDKACQLMLGSGDDTHFFLNESRYEGAKPKPVFYHSDSHKEDGIGSRYTWVKADPTFEGLKQTYYEPVERVRIQERSPQDDFPKPYFAQFRANGNIMSDGGPVYSGVTIPLNPNLVTLIGGRGTGKSLLLDCLFKTFEQDRKISDPRLDKIAPEAFATEYAKPDGSQTSYSYGASTPLSYLHVRQGDIKKYVEKPDELSKQIKELLSIQLLDEVPSYDFELQTLMERISKSKAWFYQPDSNDNLINSRGYNEARILESEKLIATVTTTQNQTLIETFKTNRQAINAKQTVRRHLADLKTTTQSYGKELDRLIAEVNQMDIGTKKLPVVDFSNLNHAIDDIVTDLDRAIKDFDEENKRITEAFRKQGIDQDIAGLLTKVEQYQGIIDSARDKLNEMESRQAEITADVEARITFRDRIALDHNEQKANVDAAFKTLKEGRESWTQDQKALVARLLKDIQVGGRIVFNADAFYEGLQELLDGRMFRSTTTGNQLDRIKQKLNVASYDDYLKLIGNVPIVLDNDGSLITLDQFAAQEDYFLRAGYSIYEYLYLHRYRSQYLSVSAIIEYKGKPPEKLSVGQRGTFYVCMKLATDPFGSPFVFDQPEDDLDNEFIMTELVPLFREIKRYRQVVIATHNANLVVNADAEQVVVAHNENEVLTYQCGALENTYPKTGDGIREHVCRILEGGQEAFEKREQKYGLKASKWSR